MYKRIIIILNILFGLVCYAQPEDTYTLRGYVIDSRTGKGIAGASVFRTDLTSGIFADGNGYFSLKLPHDSVKIAVSMVGYKPAIMKIHAMQDTMYNFYVQPSLYVVRDVHVFAEKKHASLEESHLSYFNISAEMLRNMPPIFGEPDAMRVLQLLPGVKSGPSAQTGLYIRGGSPDQNLIILDGAPVYNASHLYGFYSVFNSDVVDNISLIKGGFPARYGSRLSSVIDISLKDGDMRKMGGIASLGLAASRLMIEGPLVKNKTSFIISGRRTYVDVLSRPFRKKEEHAGYYFYDINGRITHKFSPSDNIAGSFYMGRDLLSVNEDDKIEKKYNFDLSWENLVSTIRWKHIYNSDLFSNAVLFFSRYYLTTSYMRDFIWQTSFSADYFSGIADLGLKLDYDYVPGSRYSIKFGGSYIWHGFYPDVSQKNSNFARSSMSTADVTAREVSFYVENNHEVFKPLKLNYGIHFSGFYVSEKLYSSLQPRFSLNYYFADGWTLTASYAEMSQYIHLLTTNNERAPTDLWVPSTDKIIPEESFQSAFGISYHTGMFEYSIEGYYKGINNIIEYRDGASFLSRNNRWEDNVVKGNGYALGVELLARKNVGRLTGWLSYTYSRTGRKFSELNNGSEFPSRFDRRHETALLLSYSLSKYISISGNWLFGTGHNITVPLRLYSLKENLIIDRNHVPSPGFVKMYSDRNSFRVNSYHRLDLSLKYETGNSIWALSVYNVYNRKNPALIYFDENIYNSKIEAKQINVLTIIPALSYTYKF